MLNIPYDKIVELLKEKSGLSEEEIDRRVREKISQLSDLVSKEGAAHIVANQLGISLMNLPKKLKINEIREGMRNIEAVGKVTKVFDVREFTVGEREGKVASLFIGDETGTIRVTMWGAMAENVKKAKEGDIVKVKEGYTKMNNSSPEIHLNDKSVFLVNPEGESVNEVKTSSYERKYLAQAKEGEKVEVLGTIVQIFEPRYFELCPDCMKRARPKEEGFFCEIHGKVQSPKLSYVFNAVIDDGTDNIRIVLYKQQAEEFFGKTEQEILSAKGDAQKIEALKSDVFGTTVKICGRIQTNALFDRTEFVAQSVSREVNLEQESKIVEEKVSAQ